MNVKNFALIFGIVYLLVAILGFIPGMVNPTAGDPDMAVDSMYGRLLGIFPVNIIHSIVHLLIGGWGILASRSWDASRTWARVWTVGFALLTIMGLIPGLNTTFGLIPLFSHDVWLHAVSALLTGYFGFVAPAERRVEV